MAKSPDQPAAPAGKRKFLLLILGVAALAVAGGAIVPMFLHGGEKAKHDKEVAKDAKENKPALVAFDPVVVNLAESQLRRYLRVKLLLVVDQSQEKATNDLLNGKKAFLKSWLLSHLADLSLEDVSGKVGQNRLRREIRDQFNAMLFPDGSEKISDVLFEEFVVQ